jgi:hypothetical protein
MPLQHENDIECILIHKLTYVDTYIRKLDKVQDIQSAATLHTLHPCHLP